VLQQRQWQLVERERVPTLQLLLCPPLQLHNCLQVLCMGCQPQEAAVAAAAPT
jgi:hypothetical protein